MKRKQPPGGDIQPQFNLTSTEDTGQTRDDMDAAWNSARDRRDMLADERHRHGASNLHWQETPIPSLHHAQDHRDHLLWQDAAGALHLAVMDAPAPQQGAWLFPEGAAADVVRWTLITAPGVGPPPTSRLESKAARRRT